MFIILSIYLGILSTKDFLNRGLIVWYPGYQVFMFSKRLHAIATVFVIYISYELTFHSDYASGYAIESAI